MEPMNKKNTLSKKICRNSLLLGTILLALPGSVLAAPSLPSTHTPSLPEQPATNLENNQAQPAAPAIKARFTLQKIQVDASGLDLSEARLEQETRDFLGHEITEKELGEAVQRITLYCRQHGYPAAAAYLPSQKSGQGILTVKILPGRYGEIRVENQSKLSQHLVDGCLHGLKTGDIIQSKNLETALYNISNLGGVQAAGMLSPGKTVGTSDITVRVKDGKQASYILYSENYGSKSSGRYRYGLQGTWSDLDLHGDSLHIGGLLSNHDLRNYNIGYEKAVGHAGTRAGLSVSRMDYELGGTLKAIGAKGKANTVSVYGTSPLWQTASSSQSISYGYDYHDLCDDLDQYGLSAKKHSHVFHAGVNGRQRLGQSSWAYDITASMGSLMMDSDYARTLESYSHTAGQFSKGVLSLNGQQPLGRDWDLQVKLQEQKASRNLDSSEEIYLGGANAVRAYPQGEGSGDEGWQGTMELRYHTHVPGLVLSSYLDGGHVKLSRDGESGGETLKGWGLGISYSQPGNWFARFDYARRIGLCENASNDARAKARMWFMLGKVW